jgi:hypothetical protein
VHGIFIAAILTTGIALAIFGTLLRRLKQPANGRLLLLAALIALPLEPAAFYFVRVPLDHWLTGMLGSNSPTLRWLVTLYAPVTEELAKLVPLLIPAIRRDLRRENFGRYALAIGLGFAIGEMWFLAEAVSRIPALAGTPFYKFGGYFGERLMTCVFHSVFVGAALWGWRRNFGLGVLGAMVLHWLGNFPIFLLSWNAGGMGPAFWGAVVQAWIVLYFIGALALFSYFLLGRISPGRLFYGRRKCPECGAVYDAPLFSVNLVTRRYERCPQCRHWHFTKSSV